MTENRLSPVDTPELSNYQALLAGVRVLPDEVIDARERERRQGEASKVLGRLPEFLRVPDPRQLLARIREANLTKITGWWMPEKGNLLLAGPTGRGKSSVAAYLFRKVLGRGVTYGGPAWEFALRLRWFHANDLERARAIHPLGKDEAPEILEACRATLLVIDDAGWDENPAAVRTVLNERYELGVPTILTTRLTREGLVQHYKDDGIRRLVEAGGQRVTVVEVG